MAAVSTRRVIITAMAVDGIDILTNTVVAILSGSAVMLVETISAFADFFAMGLLLIGNNHAARRANRVHPFGFGKEQYFWATLAGFIILVITANISFVFGWHAFKHPDQVSYIWLTFAVLGLGVCTNGYASLQCYNKLLQGKSIRRLWGIFMESHDMATKIAFVMDTMGAVSALIGLISLILYELTGIQTLDGLGAIAMAITLAIFSIILLVGIRSLIIGQSLDAASREKIKAAVLEVASVHRVVSLRTMVLGPDSALLTMQVNLKENLTTPQVESVVSDAKTAAGGALPDHTLQTTIEPVKGE